MRLLCFLAASLAFLLSSWAQSSDSLSLSLALENRRSGKQMVFEPGDLISIQLEGRDSKLIGTIEEVTDSQLVLIKRVELSTHGAEEYQLFRYHVRLSRIAVVYFTPSPGWRKFRRSYSATSLAGGGLIIGGATINTIVNDVTPKLSDLILSGGILVSGLALRYLGRDCYRLGKRWHLRVIPTSG